jgi:two-component system, cell cycle sensor histidine kinase and response regulator CckA
MDKDSLNGPDGAMPPGLVLVIDDEENVRLVAARMLERRGFAVLIAADGPTGVALYESSDAPVGAVLLDLSMPQMSGVEVARSLRRLDPGVRIVLMTGYAEEDARRRFAEMGVAAFLQKPFTLGDLAGAMQLVLGAPD